MLAYYDKNNLFIKCTQQALDIIKTSISEVKSGKWDQEVLTQSLLKSGLNVGAFPMHLVSTDRVYEFHPKTAIIEQVDKRPKLDAQKHILTQN